MRFQLIWSVGTSSFFRRNICLVLSHAISDTYFSEDIFGLGRIGLDLSPDVCHVYPEDLIVIIGIGSPYV